MLFSVGERVFYPIHGVGEVESIENKTVLGEAASYYIVRFYIGQVTVMIPVKTAETAGLRGLINADECESVLAYLDTPCCLDQENWSKRYRANQEKLRRGITGEIAEVVKSLNQRELERGLSSGERRMLHAARDVLYSELSFVCSREDLKQRVGIFPKIR